MGFATEVAVLFDEAPAELRSVREGASVWLADVRPPAHADAVADIMLRCSR